VFLGETLHQTSGNENAFSLIVAMGSLNGRVAGSKKAEQKV